MARNKKIVDLLHSILLQSMKLAIQIALIIGILVMGYLVYDSIDSRMDFEKEGERREAIVIERLKDIRAAQLAYKEVKGEYAKDFAPLLQFVRTEQIPIIKQIGSFDDSIAVAEGRVTRDTFFVNVRDTVYSDSYLEGRISPLHIDSLPFIPFSKSSFKMDAGEISRNNVKVKVFYVFAPNKAIYEGMDAERYNVKLNEGLSVGSMTEPSTSGNWE